MDIFHDQMLIKLVWTCVASVALCWRKCPKSFENIGHSSRFVTQKLQLAHVVRLQRLTRSAQKYNLRMCPLKYLLQHRNSDFFIAFQHLTYFSQVALQQNGMAIAYAGKELQDCDENITNSGYCTNCTNCRNCTNCTNWYVCVNCIQLIPVSFLLVAVLRHSLCLQCIAASLFFWLRCYASAFLFTRLSFSQSCD